MFIGDSFVKRLFHYNRAHGKPFLVGNKEVEMWRWPGADVVVMYADVPSSQFVGRCDPGRQQ